MSKTKVVFSTEGMPNPAIVTDMVKFAAEMTNPNNDLGLVKPGMVSVHGWSKVGTDWIYQRDIVAAAKKIVMTKPIYVAAFIHEPDHGGIAIALLNGNRTDHFHEPELYCARNLHSQLYNAYSVMELRPAEENEPLRMLAEIFVKYYRKAAGQPT